MYITAQQWQKYRESGYLLITSYFTSEEIDLIRNELPSLFNREGPQRVLEGNGLVRSVYGVHASNDLCAKLVRLPRLLEPAIHILGSDVYVYQSKINAKLGMGGDVWEWHQDFIFWHKEDGLVEPRIINMAIWLDDVNEFNGPLMFIPASHHLGMIDVHISQDQMMPQGSDTWSRDVSSKLKFALNSVSIRTLAKKNGIEAPKGPRGSLLIFDSNVFHASSSNMSPEDRAVLLITYNSVENPPLSGKSSRPTFLVSQDCKALQALPSDSLF
jgi:hypothetical protein